MNTGSDRELLVGVMSVQLGFANAQQVMTCAAEWATDRTRSLALRMEERGILTATQREMLEALVQQAITVNKGDVQQTLLSIGGEKVLQSLGGSLISPKLPKKVSAGDDDEETDPHRNSGEDLVAVSMEAVGRYTDPEGKEPTEIGRGGIGRVLIAHDHFLERDVAIKELLPSQNSGSNRGTPNSANSGRSAPAIQRFLREARVTGKLEHPNIVPVYEIGRRKNGTLYYSMKLVRGRTLAAAMISAKEKREQLALLPHFLGICNALAYAHSRGVIHRDIKPQNVMVGEFGETVVVDWGLAKVRGRKDLGRGELKKEWVELSGAHSIEGSAIGTPAYMSPEQAEGKVDDIDERSDVWSLGAMLYEVLTGRPPFDGVNPFDVIGKLLQEPVKPVLQVKPDVPKELAAIADKALQREKARRYQSAKEFADDLAAYLGGKRVSAHEYSSIQLMKRFGKRNKVSLSIGAVAIVGMVVTAAITFREVKKERDNARHFASVLITDISQDLEPLPGSGPLLKKLTTTALDYYSRNVDPASSPLDERLELAAAYIRIAEVAVSAGKYTEGVEAARFASEILSRAAKEKPDDAKIHRQLASALISEGDGYQLGSVESAKSVAAYEKAMAAAKVSLEKAPGDQDAVDTLSRAYSRLGETSQATGDLAATLRYYDLAYENDKTNVALSRSDPARYYRGLAIDLGMLGWVNVELGDLTAAESWLRQAIALEENLVREDASNKDHKINLAYDQLTLASVSRIVGKQEEYERLVTRVTELLTPLVGTDDSRALLNVYARLQLMKYDYAGGFATLQKMAEVSGSLDVQAEMVEVALRSGDSKKAIALAEKLEPELPEGTTRTATLAMHAAALAIDGDVPHARELARKAALSAERYGGTGGERPPGAQFLPTLTHARAGAVRALMNDLAAMKAKRDKDGWAKATNAFVRALDETP